MKVTGDSPQGPTQHRWWAEGYQAALRDVAAKMKEEGLPGVESWLKNNWQSWDGRFANEQEQEAYTELHRHGLPAFEAKYGVAEAHILLMRWININVVRISSPDGVYTVKTFKKFATED